MYSTTDLANRLHRATLVPDLDAFDDFMFSALRAVVAGFVRKSDKGLTFQDFKAFLNRAPLDTETIGNIVAITDALNTRALC